MKASGFICMKSLGPTGVTWQKWKEMLKFIVYHSDIQKRNLFRRKTCFTKKI